MHAPSPASTPRGHACAAARPLRQLRAPCLVRGRQLLGPRHWRRAVSQRARWTGACRNCGHPGGPCLLRPPPRLQKEDRAGARMTLARPRQEIGFGATSCKLHPLAVSTHQLTMPHHSPAQTLSVPPGWAWGPVRCTSTTAAFSIHPAVWLVVLPVGVRSSPPRLSLSPPLFRGGRDEARPPPWHMGPAPHRARPRAALLRQLFCARMRRRCGCDEPSHHKED